MLSSVNRAPGSKGKKSTGPRKAVNTVLSSGAPIKYNSARTAPPSTTRSSVMVRSIAQLPPYCLFSSPLPPGAGFSGGEGLFTRAMLLAHHRLTDFVRQLGPLAVVVLGFKDVAATLGLDGLGIGRVGARVGVGGFLIFPHHGFASLREQVFDHQSGGVGTLGALWNARHILRRALHFDEKEVNRQPLGLGLERRGQAAIEEDGALAGINHIGGGSGQEHILCRDQFLSIVDHRFLANL